MRTVKFTKKYGDYKKDKKGAFVDSLASSLVNVHKVAVYADESGEYNKKLSDKRKKELKDKKIEELTQRLEQDYLKEIEQEFEEMLKTEDGEAFKKTLKQRILDNLTEELKEE